MKKFLAALMITALAGASSAPAIAAPVAFHVSQDQDMPDIIDDGNDGQAPTEDQPSPGSGLIQLQSLNSKATIKSGKFKVNLVCQTADGCMDARLSIHGQVHKKQYSFKVSVPETASGTTSITVKVPANITKAIKKYKTKSVKFTVFGPAGFTPGHVTTKTS